MAVEAKRQGLCPVLAGRRAGPIEALAEDLGLPARVFDLGHPRAAAAALGDMAVMSHCAGPFSATSAQMIERLSRSAAADEMRSHRWIIRRSTAAIPHIDRVGEGGMDGVEKRLCGRVMGRPAAAGQSPHCAPRAGRRGRGRTAAS